jgi:hypothetical protein
MASRYILLFALRFPKAPLQAILFLCLVQTSLSSASKMRDQYVLAAFTSRSVSQQSGRYVASGILMIGKKLS